MIAKYQRHKTESENEFAEEKYHIYDDSGLSANDINRPELQRLLNDVKEGTINKVIINDVSELSRNENNLLTIIKVIKDYNVELQCGNKKLDINSIENVLNAVIELQ